VRSESLGRLDGKVALVTGAKGGIGFATARRFAREGAKVCVAYVDGEGAATAAGKIDEENLDAFSARLDVSNRAEVETCVQETVERFGHLDILVNNAGIARDSLLFKMTDEDWRLVLDVHLTGTFLCSRAAQKHMVEKGYGRIVNISSIAALGNRGQANYSAAKAGVLGFTKTLATELGPYGITVNSVAPGFVETEMTRATAARLGVDFETFATTAVKGIPVGRGGKPDDIAAAVLFFASEEASFINGQVLYATGGPTT
jgi:3-oxoacyl-[acyl-carrier protein] reductase